MLLKLLQFIIVILCSATVVFAQTPFTSGNIVVYRIGDGSAALTNAATATFLDEYTTTGTLVRSIALPTAVSGANFRITNSGTATSEGALTLSPNSQYLCFAGYDATLGTASIAGTASASNNRVVGFVKNDAVVNTTTALNDAYTGNNIRGAATVDGTAFWTSGTVATTGGTRYATVGATTSTQISATITNTRIVNIFNGQLYVSSATGAFFGISSVGTGIPTTTGQTTTLLTGFPTATGPSPYGFVAFDLNAGVAGIDALYVADDRTTGLGGLQRWDFNGTTWTLTYTLSSGLTASTGLRGVAGQIVSGNPVFYVTSTDNKIYSVTDTGVSSAFTAIVTGATNTGIRGIAFAPIAAASDTPVATAATSVTQNGFTANWNTLTGATEYRLDVSADNFATFVTGFDNLSVSGTSQAVTGLTASTAYKYRVRAIVASVTSPNSNTIDVTTLSPTATVNLTISGVSGTESAATVITATLTASGAVTGDQTVSLGVSGTNVTAADYALSNSTITILNGQTTGTVTFTVANDADLEGTEIARLTISNPSAGLTLGANTSRDLLLYDNDFAAAPTANNEIQLALESSYTNVAVNSLPTLTNSAEISAYDPASKRLFIVNSLGKKLNIVDMSNPAALSAVGSSIDITTYGNINSVAVRNGIVALAMENIDPQANGSVVFMNTDGVFQKQVTVGVMPDMITFNPNGNLVLTANEGEPKADYTIDPEGSVSIIDISGGVANLTQTNVSTANFNAFDSQAATLRSQGVRIYGLMQPSNTPSTVSQDLEPEYITFSADGSTAYVTLQEANAIGVLDIATKTITAIRPLGLKDHNVLTNGLDASDQGGVVNIANLPVKGMFQPDAIASFQVGGTNYLVTANEGDSRAYTAPNNEELRINAAAYVLDPTVFPNASLLKTNSILGRLQVTNKTGDTDGDGDFDEIHVYGSRSFTIWQPTATGLTRVFDSGDQLERIILANATYGAIFNASHDNNNLKDRSDNKGPEPEGVTTATLNGQAYAFVSLERIGGVLVYNVTNPASPVFVQYINNRVATPAVAASGNLGSEGIIFVSAANSPTGVPLLILSNEISSTVSVYSVGGVSLPVAPSNLTHTLSNTQLSVVLNWTDNASNESGFEIQRSTNANSGFTTLATLNANVVTYTDNTIVNAQTYYYRVRAISDFGYSAYTANREVVVNLVVPAAPTALTVTTTLSPLKNTLNWTDNANNEIGYRVERKTTIGAFEQIAETGAVNTYEDNTAVLGTSYNYRVRAYNVIGNSPYSNESNAIVTSIEDEIFSRSINVFPNPSKGETTLKVELAKAGKLTIFNHLGKVLQTLDLPNPTKENIYNLPTKNLAQGLYYLQIEISGRKTVRKLVIQ